MKEKNNGGFSLVEVLLAMMILAAIVIPVCSGILLSVRMGFVRAGSAAIETRR